MDERISSPMPTGEALLFQSLLDITNAIDAAGHWNQAIGDDLLLLRAVAFGRFAIADYRKRHSIEPRTNTC